LLPGEAATASSGLGTYEKALALARRVIPPAYLTARVTLTLARFKPGMMVLAPE
jgi:hypothetical protein